MRTFDFKENVPSDIILLKVIKTDAIGPFKRFYFDNKDAPMLSIPVEEYDIYDDFKFEYSPSHGKIYMTPMLTIQGPIN